jgi:hypothetical protein
MPKNKIQIPNKQTSGVTVSFWFQIVKAERGDVVLILQSIK